MTREKNDEKTRRSVKVLEALDQAMPEAHIELDYTTPLELVVAVLLSAQARDARVNLATPALFKDFKTAADYAKATPQQLEPYIQTLGLFRNKAKNLVALGKALVAEHGGVVPLSRAALEALPGVGRKTAGVVTIHLGGDPAFPVDTHVHRLSGRLNFAKGKTPDEVEDGLQKVVPQPWWTKGHQLLVWHGRRVCHALKPECHRCVVADDCPKVGVKAPAATRPSKASSSRARSPGRS